MEFDLKNYSSKIFLKNSEFDLCILVREADNYLAQEIKSIIERKNPSKENQIKVFYDEPYNNVNNLK
jgi:hypothetical protein